MKETSRTAIIVVGYHGKRWLPECIASVDETMERREHLYVVDNSGNEGSIPESVSTCKYRIEKTERPLGFAAANNFALERLSEPVDYVCFLNQDTLCRPGWLERCVEVLDANQSVAAVSPMLYSFGWSEWNPNFLSCMMANATLMDSLADLKQSPVFFPVPVIPAAAMVVRTSVLRDVGTFDSVYGSYYEDFDLCRRMGNAGFQVGVCTNSEVAHYDSITDSRIQTPENIRRQSLIVRNRMIYDLRYADRARWKSALLHYFVQCPRLLARGVLRRGAYKPVRAVLRGYLSAMALLPRLCSETIDTSECNISLNAFQQKFQRFSESKSP